MILDIAVLLFVIYGFYKGVKEGFFVSVAAFLSFLIGIIAALKFSNVIKSYLYLKFSWDSTFMSILAFVVTFGLAIFIVHFIAKMVTEIFNAMYLGLFNRFFGGIFEVLRVLLFSCLILALFEKVNVNHVIVAAESLQLSKFYVFYSFIAEEVFPSLFHLVDTLFDKSVEVIKDMKEVKSI